MAIKIDLVGDTVVLTDEQKNYFDKGLKDIEEGNIISNEESKNGSKTGKVDH